MKLLIAPVILVLAACSGSDDNNQSPANTDSGNAVSAPDATNPDDAQAPNVTPAPDDAPDPDDDTSPPDDPQNPDDDTSPPDNAPNPDDDPVTTGLFLNRDNHVEVLAHVFDVISGRALTPSIIDIPTNPELYATFVSEFVPQSDFPEGDNRVGSNYSCNNGGTVTQIFLEDTGNTFRELSFDNCLAGNLVLNGDMNAASPARTARHYRSMSISFADNMQTTIDVSGSVDTDTSRSLFDEYITRSTMEFDYRRTSVDGVLAVSNSQTDFWYGPHVVSSSFDAFLEAGFELESTAFSGKSVTVETLQAFSFATAEMLTEDAINTIGSSWNFSTGQIRITTDDGSSLLLDANTGDDTTVSITLDNDSGEEVFQQPWSLWRGNLVIDLPQTFTKQSDLELASGRGMTTW